jgi:cytochrome c551/c552
MKPLPTLFRALCLGTLMASSLAHASAELAADKGCYACHGDTPQKNAPTFAQLAAHFASHQGQPGAEDKLAGELRKRRLLGRITAHENLSEDSAHALARWIIGGAK